MSKLSSPLTKEDEDSGKMKKESWYDFEDSDTEIPSKQQLPAPPRSLLTVDSKKYGLQRFMSRGKLIESKRKEAYNQYYKVKFERK